MLLSFASSLLRRDFLRHSGSLALLATLCQKRSEAAEDKATGDLIARLTAANDAKIPKSLARQETQPDHRWVGASVGGDGSGGAGGDRESWCGIGQAGFGDRQAIPPGSLRTRGPLGRDSPSGRTGQMRLVRRVSR